MRSLEETMQNQTIPNLHFTCQQIKLMSSNSSFTNIFKSNKESVLETISNWKEFEEERRKKNSMKKSPKASVDTNILLQHMIDPRQYEIDKRKEREKQELIEKEKQYQILLQQKAQAFIEKKRLEEQALAASKLVVDSPTEIPTNSQVVNETLDIQKELTKEEIVKYNLSSGKDEDIFYNHIDDYDDDENTFLNYNNDQKDLINPTPTYTSPLKIPSSEVMKNDSNISKMYSSVSIVKPEIPPINPIRKHSPPKLSTKENKESSSTSQIITSKSLLKPSINSNQPSISENNSKLNVGMPENPSPPKQSNSSVIKVSNAGNPVEEMAPGNKHISNFTNGNKESMKHRPSKIIIDDEEESQLKEDKKENRDDKSGCEVNNTKIRIMLGPSVLASYNENNQQDEAFLKKKTKRENATPISVSSRSEGYTLKKKQETSNESYIPLREREDSVMNNRKMTIVGRADIKPINHSSISASTSSREVATMHTATSLNKQSQISDPRRKDQTQILSQRLEMAVNEVKQKIIGFSLEDIDLENFNKSLSDIYEKIVKLPELDKSSNSQSSKIVKSLGMCKDLIRLVNKSPIAFSKKESLHYQYSSILSIIHGFATTSTEQTTGNTQYINHLAQLVKYVYCLTKFKSYSNSELEKMTGESSRFIRGCSTLPQNAKEKEGLMLKLLKDQSEFIYSSINLDKAKHEISQIFTYYNQAIQNDKEGKLKYKIADCTRIEQLIESIYSKSTTESVSEIIQLFTLLMIKVNKQ